MTNHDLPDETVERIESNRDDLQQIAESDLPVDWVADALLAIADGDDGGESVE